MGRSLFKSPHDIDWHLHMALALPRVCSVSGRVPLVVSSNDYTHCLPRLKGVDALGRANHCASCLVIMLFD